VQPFVAGAEIYRGEMIGLAPAAGVGAKNGFVWDGIIKCGNIVPAGLHFISFTQHKTGWSGL
jgi:hypothetical protein